MNYVDRLPLLKRHFELRQHELGAQVMGHRPADDTPAPRVDYDGQVQKPGVCRHVGDVGDPELVRPRRREVAIDEVESRPAVDVAPRGRDASLSPADADKLSLPHEPRHAADADPRLAFFDKVAMNARRAVRASRAHMEVLDALDRPRVFDGASRRRAFHVRVVPARGDTEHPT